MELCPLRPGDLERDLRVRVSNVDISDAAGERGTCELSKFTETE